MYYNLKALIKAIRATKTQSEERALIQKESADIRTSFKTPTTTLQRDSIGASAISTLTPYLSNAGLNLNTPTDLYNNIAKLLYIHMLGYPAHFGQIECLKLVAGAGGGGSATGGGGGGARFADKRLGYLGVGVLLDENQEVLTLVTNSLKNDMNHSNMYVVGLALCIFANIASEEMSRDLVNEVEKLLGSGNAYIRRKAALCALRIIKRVPDLIDHFVPRITSLLSDKNHGVLLCGVTLITEIFRLSPSTAQQFGGRDKAVPLLVRHLKALVTTGYSPEHDVGGITDPFLQVKVLRLLRVLGKGDKEAGEEMNDVLAQVATNTDSSKNVGNAILYECVLTILDIEAESGLRVMAINILGKFLGNRDNNIRYVALNTLAKVVQLDTQAVQRHRSIILDCLRDGDISIRRRALELSYELINSDNVRILIRELLAFLEVADNEFKFGMTAQIGMAAERYAPNRRWHIDTVLRVLKLAGNYVREDLISSFIRLVTHTEELQLYTSQKLYLALKEDVSQEGLTICGLWVLGEYGNMLIRGGVETEEGPKPVTEEEVIELVESCLLSPYCNHSIRQYALTSLTKLSARVSSAEQQARIKKILSGFEKSLEVDIQQRTVEFEHLLDMGEEARRGVLDRMPKMEVRVGVMGGGSEKRDVGSTKGGRDTVTDLIGGEDNSTPTSPTNSTPVKKQTTEDLLGEIFGGGASSGNSNPAPQPQAQPGKASIDDILGLFGGGGVSAGVASTSMSSQVTSTPSAPNSNNALFDVLGSTSSPQPQVQSPPSQTFSPPPQQPQQSPSFIAYDSNGLKIELSPSKTPQANVVIVTAKFTAEGGNVEGINFQAAVPKNQKLAMSAISNSNVPAGGTATQQMKIGFPAGAQIRLRLRISYNVEGSTRQDQTDFAFPPGAI